MKVFLHTRSYGHVDWTNEDREFERLPIEGEYVALKEVSEHVYRVLVVIHCPFEHAKCKAEVFAVETNRKELDKKILSDVYKFR